MYKIGIVIKLMFLITFIMLTVSLVISYNKCPVPQVVYKYIPRTFNEEQSNPVPLNDIFYEMFNNQTPWAGSVDVESRKSQIGESLNKYFVSQI